MNKNARDIQQEIMSWAKHNFEYQDTIGHGMVEEIGEFCHHTLKFKQNIRGHSGTKDEIKFQAELKDSIGDAIIFCMQWSGFHDAFLSFDTADHFALISCDMAETEILGGILLRLGHILLLSDGRAIDPHSFQMNSQMMLDRLAALASNHGWDYKEILTETWKEVKKRDWIKYPKTGLP